ncbi:tetratricopeptide repeat protein [Undibacterium sp. Jales W-56]|uniref:tetratricopeptide repeat protein n=1 Tax=Undibacterium sp. Jales W-56 TaxID=2897325 RepID=UPI0021D10964|nr:tetratricopeptide repeat protein [Undibacterium sp. Jales W-56]MCU6432705.1 tetratricopeptide repeat protein [Undibacterium sp. Jales W-56]
MSLINQMLQDLDKRGVAINPLETGPAAVRAIPDEPFGRDAGISLARKILLASLIVAAAGVAFWLAWRPIRPTKGMTAALAATPKKTALSASQPPAAAVTADASAKAVAGSARLNQVEQQLNAEALPPLSAQLLHLKMSPDLDAIGRWAIAEKNTHGRERGSELQPSQAPGRTSGIAEGRSASAAMPDPAAGMSSNAQSTVPAATPAPTSAPTITAIKTVKETTPQQQADNEYRQARSLLQQGRNADAIASLEQVLKFDPQHAAARQSLISILIDSKRHEDAIRWLQSGLALDKSQVNLAMILARLQVEKLSVTSAIETLQRSVSYAAERADYLAFLAALQQREGHHKEAADLYVNALKKNPQSGVWWMGLGISLQADGRNSDATDAFQRAKSSNSLSPELQAYVEQRISQLHAR